MKQFWIFLVWCAATLGAQAQGVFSGSSVAVQTRLGSLDGPLAGATIFGQMLAGPAADLLLPVGPAGMHGPTGRMSVGGIVVPGVPPYQDAYVQMVAWDSTYWGETLAGVPENQLGRTDVVTVFLVNAELGDPRSAPRFTQPAIVPPIPEPSVWSLALLGGLLGLSRFRRRWTVTR